MALPFRLLRLCRRLLLPLHGFSYKYSQSQQCRRLLLSSSSSLYKPKQNCFHTAISCRQDEAKSQLAYLNPKMQITYTCRVCQTRSSKTFSKVSYERGVVFVRCPGCQNLHLIADNLNYFTESGKTNVEKILSKKGEKVMRNQGPDGTLEILPD
ncbi:DNL-type zinc finger protein-like [Argonauta hians]